MSVTIINSANFKEEVLNSDRPVIIDLWAEWCSPCRMMGPIIEELSEEHPEIKFCKINVDEETSLALQFQVSSIPMLVAFKNGQPYRATIGLQPAENILALLK